MGGRRCYTFDLCPQSVQAILNLTGKTGKPKTNQVKKLPLLSMST